MEYNIMRELIVNEISLVSGGVITKNKDGTKTANEVKDCTVLYPSNLGDMIGCKIDIAKNKIHKTLK